RGQTAGHPGGLVLQVVAAVGLLSHQLARARHAEALLDSAVGLHLRHGCRSPSCRLSPAGADSAAWTSRGGRAALVRAGGGRRGRVVLAYLPPPGLGPGFGAPPGLGAAAGFDAPGLGAPAGLAAAGFGAAAGLAAAGLGAAAGWAGAAGWGAAAGLAAA